MVEEFDLEVLEETQIDPAEIDTDGDGIYDEWELRYGLDPNRPDSFIDTDQDLFTNFQEFQNGTDPTRSVSHPPYGLLPETRDPTDVDYTEDQYKAITLTFGLITLLILMILIYLAYTKTKSFKREREEEKELEIDEIEYRESLKSK
jgi:hypothetical protein